MKNYVKIVNIIDRSGSMSSMIDTAIGGFNEFLQEQQNIEGDALVSTMLFSSKFHNLYENLDIQECKFLNKDNYQPNGTTALYDAIFFSINNEINQLGNLSKAERPEKTLCVILTDGYENASRNCSREKIKEMIKEMKKDFNWEFIFLGANEDASLTAESMGISKGNSYAFTNSSTGLKDAYTAVSFATTSYRQSKSTILDDVMIEYTDQKAKNK